MTRVAPLQVHTVMGKLVGNHYRWTTSTISIGSQGWIESVILAGGMRRLVVGYLKRSANQIPTTQLY